MANKLTHAVVHCSASPAGRELTKDQLAIMHMGPSILRDKLSKAIIGYKYMRKTYYEIEELPNEKIAGASLKTIIKMGGGRGFSQFGYNKFMHLNGNWETLVPFDNNEFVDSWELTNGILAKDSIFFNCLNFMYVGGMNKAYTKWEDTRTPSQNQGWINLISDILDTWPDIQIIGHNQLTADRSCPSFNVPEWMRNNKFPEKNISNEPIKFLGKLVNAY